MNGISKGLFWDGVGGGDLATYVFGRSYTSSCYATCKSLKTYFMSQFLSKFAKLSIVINTVNVCRVGN